MNGDDLNLGDVNPDWLDQGLGFGEEFQTEEQLQGWDTDVRTQGADDTQDEVSAGAGGGITVQTGPFSGGYAGTVDNVTTITLDEDLFQIQDNGGGEVLVSLKTTTCS